MTFFSFYYYEIQSIFSFSALHTLFSTDLYCSYSTATVWIPFSLQTEPMITNHSDFKTLMFKLLAKILLFILRENYTLPS
jgi:hypothetical protein